jgi:N utilization substance protein B
MGTRRKGRQLAVQALYQIEVRGEKSAEALLRLFWETAEAGAQSKAFGETLVRGVREEKERIDDLIGKSTEHWRIERLSPVDLGVLRVATYELLRHRDVPTSVVLDEAIEVARRFGSTESANFVNGVLDQIAQRLGVKEDSNEREATENG